MHFPATSHKAENRSRIELHVKTATITISTFWQYFVRIFKSNQYDKKTPPGISSQGVTCPCIPPNSRVKAFEFEGGNHGQSLQGIGRRFSRIEV